jgi:hypothetical protein
VRPPRALKWNATAGGGRGDIMGKSYRGNELDITILKNVATFVKIFININ